MQMNLTEFRLCPNCGSPGYLENYPTPGNLICGKCGHRTIKIHLTQMTEDEVYDTNCTSCGKEGEDGDTLFENYGVAVFKCKKCGTIDGYEIIEKPDYFDWGDDNPYDGNYSYKTIKNAEKEGTPNILSAANYEKIAKALKKKEKDPKTICKKRLQALVNIKLENLVKAGLEAEEIKVAISKVECFINKNGEVTDKKLMILFFSALYVNQEATTKDKNSQKVNLKERAMQEISGIDRKTIRKWKKVFEEKQRN
jgi:ribosomal protein S27AE